MLGALKCAQEYILRGIVGNKAGRSDEAGKCKTVTDALEKGPAEPRAGEETKEPQK